MLRRLALRDFAIVPVLELDFQHGFSVLTGETGAGKSILIDALQLALGGRGDVGVVREGEVRAEISAEFDVPALLATWLDEAGFAGDDSLLLRRTIDTQGKSRAWINGSAATVAQLREAAEHLVEIHGQHAWQSLTRAASARALLDAQAQLDPAALVQAFAERKAALAALQRARDRHDDIQGERERLAWNLSELDQLAPLPGEWDELDAEHRRLSHAQALIEAARHALELSSEADANAEGLAQQALSKLQDVVAHDGRLAPMVAALQDAVIQLREASHGLTAYLDRAELDPQRLAALDTRISSWMGLARRHRRPPAELPALGVKWRAEVSALDSAVDIVALEQSVQQTDQNFRRLAQQLGQARRTAAPALAQAVTQAMQTLGMPGGQFDVAITALVEPQAHGMESVEFLVAGHAGTTPRPLAKVASGGELSRLALAIAVTTLDRGDGPGTLIFDEIDAGIGGAVGDSVGALMKQLGRTRQVLAVTHLAQVASCADQHYVVAKAVHDGKVASTVGRVDSSARVTEVARMLGGDRSSRTSLAHAQALLQDSVLPAARSAAPVSLDGAVPAVPKHRQRSKA